MKKVTITPSGIRYIGSFLENSKARRNKLVNSGRDTANDTVLPTFEDIEADILHFEDKDGDYYNSWGITDHMSCPLYLKRGLHYEIKEKLQ